MTKKSKSRLDRDQRKIPKRDNIAGIFVDHQNERVAFTTKDMLINQLHRDGPRVARSFDRLAKQDIADCSAVFGEVQAFLMRHLPRIEDADFKPTVARLVFSACNTYAASIEVARHGYPRQFGMLARVFIETIATVIVITIKEGALEQYHAGTLSSTKCVSWANPVLPELGKFWGMLSNEFVHIGKSHSILEFPSGFEENMEALGFIVAMLRGNIWLLLVVAHLVFSDDGNTPRFWKRDGSEARLDLSPEMKAWTEEFLKGGQTPETGSVS